MNRAPSGGAPTATATAPTTGAATFAFVRSAPPRELPACVLDALRTMDELRLPPRVRD